MVKPRNIRKIINEYFSNREKGTYLFNFDKVLISYVWKYIRNCYD